MQAVYETDFKDLKLIKRGKVRDIYDMGESLLMVATDRISAFDVIMPDPVPDKGKILTQISLFWFDIMKSVVPNHLISADVDDFPSVCKPYAGILRHRSMMVKKAEPLSIECVVRGYISGSGWKDYQESGRICGIKLSSGLQESDKLPENIFTPATKEEQGAHDINISFEKAAGKIGSDLAKQAKTVSLKIYEKGSKLADEKGIIIADTKFEFGLYHDDLILIDEILTPDSSRFWPKASYKPGGAQKSFDKQYLRDYLLSLDWNKKAPGPSIPGIVLANTRKKYLEAYDQLTSTKYAL